MLVDDVHLHRGTKGVQLAYLLRRLKSRPRHADPAHSRRLTIVGPSTTLAQPRSFFAALTGILEREIDVVVPRPGDMRRYGAKHIVFVRAPGGW